MRRYKKIKESFFCIHLSTLVKLKSMLSSFFLCALLLASIFSSQALASTIDCNFKSSYLRPNRASCSMDPEEVFSNKYDQKKLDEHCIVKNPFEELTLGGDYLSFHINAEKKLAHWYEVPTGKQKELIQKLIKEANSKGDTQKAEHLESQLATQKYGEVVDIVEHEGSTIVVEDFNGEPTFSKMKYTERIYFIQQIGGNGFLSIWLAEPSKKAILNEYTFSQIEDSDNTWIELRFGKCSIN